MRLSLIGAFALTATSLAIPEASSAEPSLPSHSAGLEPGREAASGSNGQEPPLLAKAAPQDVARARAIVQDAIKEAAVHNKARFQNPTPNRYLPTVRDRFRRARDNAPQLMEVSPEVRRAAALVAEADAWSASRNGTSSPYRRRAAG
ncbi:hypothetical protein RF55_26458, partial [Lasius niger]